MLADSGKEAIFLVPTLSWITSADRKLHQNRLLNREIQALTAIHFELHRSMTNYACSPVSPIERFSLNLLEHYQSSSALRTSWEARCAIGNMLTLAMMGGRSEAASLIAQVMQASNSSQNWDLAQMLFDALHHAETLTTLGREFLLTTAVQHEHEQIRWNVAAALKSTQLSENDLKQILNQLLHDPSPWVVKELVDVALGNDRILAELSYSRNTGHLLDILEQDSRLLEHTLLSLKSRNRRSFVPRFTSLLPEGTFNRPYSEFLRAQSHETEPSGYDWQMLEQDFSKVEEMRSRLRGQHGKTYKAAERVVMSRIGALNPERQRIAITTYLHCTHDALAWASVRALFSGKLDQCGDDFLSQAISDMLRHPSEWIRRECVEEALRLEDGRLRYIALRQIEAHRHQLAQVAEIQPYLAQIGMKVTS